ncbi:hypothetical protein [Leucobacter sp. M11]|uniref:hypothetical protein n=1 Tax=Leucobacter sp. M11 TaxID=2993565 RepID=UPI002D8017D9|nr:hypothetical protein [Leucobacter sp. M11]MEB4614036.1 hypothetical protein [Leucobacter sp. M11]
MTRNRASAKAAGARQETLVAKHLAEVLEDDRVERRTKNGAKDRGDITGVRTLKQRRVVIEVKDYGGQVKVKPWLDEAEIERGNDDAHIGVVAFKRQGIGPTRVGETGVLMTLDTFAKLLADWGVADIEIRGEEG